MINREVFNIEKLSDNLLENVSGGLTCKQTARAFGSYPKCRWFESICRYQNLIWPGGQAAKTPPFHGGNTSSILVRVTIKTTRSIACRSFFGAPGM